MTTPAPPPAWVRKRDGRIVPFDADRISRALFAATEGCGRPDAFLARELADVVVHFLAEEAEGTVPGTDMVGEVVLKVLRELRQPALAARFAEFSQQRSRANGRPTERVSADGMFRYDSSMTAGAVRDGCLRDYSLRAVFTRDLAAAHREGLIVLGGLERPSELESSLVVPGPAEGLLGRLQVLARTLSHVIVMEGVEQTIARGLPARTNRNPAMAEKAARAFVEELTAGLQLSGRAAVVNLNGPPPPWAMDSDGPLFARLQRPADRAWLQQLALAIAEQVQRATPFPPGRLRVHWHFSKPDFKRNAREHLLRLARLALQTEGLTFAFDRPRMPTYLAEGITRKSPSVLMAVGLNLSGLASVTTEDGGLATVTDRFLGRLKSLTRLALSAGIQKRAFLRRQISEQPDLGGGFLLERGRLLVAPLGLDETVKAMLGQRVCGSDHAQAFGCAILHQMIDVLRDEGRNVGLDACVDTAFDLGPSARPTCWDATAPVARQLAAAGALHAAVGSGTAAVMLPGETLPSPKEMAEWLKLAWKKTDVRRVHFERARTAHQQLSFEIE